MVSPRKLSANRLNARKSTGPRTPAGKAASAQNAIRHGLLSRIPVLAGLGETADGWAAYRRQVVDALHPDGDLELALAERIAFCLWRLSRAGQFETAASAVVFAPAAALPHPAGLRAGRMSHQS